MQRSLWALVSGARPDRVVLAAILAHSAGFAYFVLHFPGTFLQVDYTVLPGTLIGLSWAGLLLCLSPWYGKRIGVGRRVYSYLLASVVSLFGLFFLGLARAIIRPALFSDVPFWPLFVYPRVFWLIITVSLFSVALLAWSSETKGLRYERDNLQVVLQFSESVSLMGKDGVLQETVNTIRRLTHADACLLFLLDVEADVLRVAAHYHDPVCYSPEYVEKMISFPCPRGHGITGRVMETGEPYLSGDVEKDPRAIIPYGYRRDSKTILLLPMKVQGRLIGVLRVAKLGANQLSEAHVTVCAILANHAAVALDAGNLYHDVLKASRTDPLTALGNAREFREALEKAVSERTPFALLMVDADSLKQVNDTFGHHAGDELLIGVANHLRQAAEGVGQAYRYAGDEFLLLVPGVDRAGARRIAERVRQGLADMHMVSEAGSVHTTVSIGVAGFPSDGADADSVMRAADKAMYSAKQAGKNQVRLAS